VKLRRPPFDVRQLYQPREQYVVHASSE
jgi:hypothetical protein